MIVEKLQAELFVARAGAALKGEKKIFGNGVGLVPGIGLVGAGTPTYAMLDGGFGKMRQRGIRGVLEDGECIGIVHVLGASRSDRKRICRSNRRGSDCVHRSRR